MGSRQADEAAWQRRHEAQVRRRMREARMKLEMRPMSETAGMPTIEEVSRAGMLLGNLSVDHPEQVGEIEAVVQLMDRLWRCSLALTAERDKAGDALNRYIEIAHAGKDRIAELEAERDAYYAHMVETTVERDALRQALERIRYSNGVTDEIADIARSALSPKDAGTTEPR